MGRPMWTSSFLVEQLKNTTLGLPQLKCCRFPSQKQNTSNSLILPQREDSSSYTGGQLLNCALFQIFL